MKNALTILGVALDAALLALSLLLMVGGYLWWGVVALAAAGVLVFAAARFWLHTPEPGAEAPREWHVWDEELDADLSPVERQMLRDGSVPIPDEVDTHAAQMIRALSGRPAVLPERGLLDAQRPQCPEGMMFNGDVATLIRCERRGGHDGNHQGQGREWPHLPQITNFEVPW